METLLQATLQVSLTFLLLICGAYQRVTVAPATYLPDGLEFRQAAELYYQTYPEAVYGHVTRYGSDDLAFRELYNLSQEYRSQITRGYGLLGGGYGYRWIGGREYLIDNRASDGYWMMADKISEPFPNHNSNQLNLLKLSMMSPEQARAYIDREYAGIISVKSPNDIGREFCMIDFPSRRVLGKVIVGGVAGRHDWMYFGESVNDFYGHLRIGQRSLELGGVDYYWLADVTDRLWGRGMKYALLLPPEMCDCN
jgi:hypothetical protein